jgi:AraC family transcriptional regulator
VSVEVAGQSVNQPQVVPVPDGLTLSSEPLGWQHLTLTKWEGVPPQEADEPSLPAHLIVVHMTSQPVGVEERGDGLKERGIAKAGDINVFSAGESSYCRWDSELSFVRLDLSPAYVQQVAQQIEAPGSGSIELRHQLRASDPKLFQLIQWLVDAASRSEPGGQLYMDSLTNLMTVHLLRQYASAGHMYAKAPSRMTDREVARAVEYMHAHLGRDISLNELSGFASVSPSHMTRLFKQATGFTPHQYLIGLRVERAKALIRSGAFTMGEIAAAAGFADQSHMNRHFKRFTGQTPKAYERQ